MTIIPYTTLVGVIRAGGSIIVDSTLPYSALIELARLVAGTQKTVTIRNASKLSYSTLVNLARIGNANIIFDFSNEKK
ncbi:hypothetical protein AMJ47_02730 [Parcubacteria bacterium DG_72]|nr:MAG: hypothetical protein AMJ47_02730 [Parcubacteria bacterium DG_72]